jgi:Protein of unknown function (DUF3752)
MEEYTKKYVKSSKYVEEDVSKRPFDREKDVAGRRVDFGQRMKMMQSAQGFSSRFAKGSG